MKRIILSALALFCLIALIVIVPSSQTNAEFLRIHIRADSNDSADQEVKYKVKAAVTDYLTPYLVKATSKEKAMEIVSERLRGIEEVCNAVLSENGFDYRSNVKLCREQFPDRSYNGVTLPSGVYDALIVELGSAEGNNWWCVVYPPLCFVGGENNGTNSIVYKSKLLEIIEKWKSK
ncbi:MAG: stage II sporulation protein R [Corallococcus sp.]|nr:stage II sporulation protein R [Corallococcus sp.]